MENLIFTVVFILIISAIINLISKKLKISSVVLLILAGLIIGRPTIERIVINQNLKEIEYLGNFALIALMFLAGLESSWRELYQERSDALAIAFCATLFPFLIGLSVFWFLGFSFTTSAVMGVSMSIAAEATKARVLIEMKKLKTKVGAALMGAGIIDDLIGLFIFLVITFLMGKLDFQENILIISAILSFLAGLLTHKLLGRNKKIIKITENIFTWSIIPFFFISLGLHFKFFSIASNPGLLILIVFLAPLATISGAMMAKPFTDLSRKQLYLIGWGMNSRGAIGLALAFVAFRGGFISSQLYSGLIVMALLTTIIFPFVIKKMIKNNPKIMN